MDTSNDIFPCNSPWDMAAIPIDHHQLFLPFDFTAATPFPDFPFSLSPLPYTTLYGEEEEDDELVAVVEEEEERDEEEEEEEEEEKLGPMKEMMYRVAAMQPVDIDPTTVRRPRRRNVRISDDPQSVAARHRRQRISERLRILQRLVPGGTKLDTASMLEEAVRYVKFLKRQIRLLQSNQLFWPSSSSSSSPPPPPIASAMCNNQ